MISLFHPDLSDFLFARLVSLAEIEAPSPSREQDKAVSEHSIPLGEWLTLRLRLSWALGWNSVAAEERRRCRTPADSLAAPTSFCRAESKQLKQLRKMRQIRAAIYWKHDEDADEFHVTFVCGIIWNAAVLSVTCRLA